MSSSKVFLDIDVGDAAAWRSASDMHARATDFLHAAGHQARAAIIWMTWN